MATAGSHHTAHHVGRSSRGHLTVVPHAHVALVPPAVARRRRWPQIGRVTLILAALGIIGVGIVGAELLRRPVVPAARFVIAPVTRGDLQPMVRGQARLAPWRTSRVRAGADGQVQEVRVREGDRVSAGDVLATLQRRPLALAVRRADAQLAVAEAAAVESEVRTSRALEELDDRGQSLPAETENLSDSEIHVAVAYARKAGADAEVAARQVTLALARSQLRSANIKATATGIVWQVAVEEGSAVTGGQALFTLAGEDAALRAVVRVGDAEIGRVRIGQSASVTVAGFPGRVFPAQVAAVPLASRMDARAAGFPVTLIIVNKSGQLRAGMLATGTIAVAPVTHVLRVPVAALAFRPAAASSDDRPAVWSVRGGEPVRIPVTVGARDGDLVQVDAAALFEGAPVVVAARGGPDAAGGPSAGRQR